MIYPVTCSSFTFCFSTTLFPEKFSVWFPDHTWEVCVIPTVPFILFISHLDDGTEWLTPQGAVLLFRGTCRGWKVWPRGTSWSSTRASAKAGLLSPLTPPVAGVGAHRFGRSPRMEAPPPFWAACVLFIPVQHFYPNSSCPTPAPAWRYQPLQAARNSSWSS